MMNANDYCVMMNIEDDIKCERCEYMLTKCRDCEPAMLCTVF